jgi:hypothetical protein
MTATGGCGKRFPASNPTAQSRLSPARAVLAMRLGKVCQPASHEKGRYAEAD